MASRSPTLDELRRYAIARSLFKPLTLPGAIRKLGFVQADPMRAPARAQDPAAEGIAVKSYAGVYIRHPDANVIEAKPHEPSFCSIDVHC